MRNSFWGCLAAFVVFLVLLPGTLFAASDTSASENTIENGMHYVALPFVDAPEEEMDFASPFRGMMLMSRAAISPDISDQQMVATVKLTLAATLAKEFALTDKDIFDTDEGVTIQLLRVDGPQKFTPVQEKVIHSLDEFQFDPVPRFKPDATNPHQASSRIQYLIGLPEAFELAPAVAIIQKPPMWDPKQYLRVTYEVILRQIINSEVRVKWVDDETVDSRSQAFAPLELKVKLMSRRDSEGPIAEFLPQYETEEVGYGREDWFLPVGKGYLDRRSGLDMLYGLDISSHYLGDDGAGNDMIDFYVSTKPVEGYGVGEDEPGIYDGDHSLLPPRNGLEYMVDLKGDIKNGYTATFRQLKELKFDSGEWGRLKEDQKVQKIGKGLKVELPVPSNVPEGYQFFGWKVQGQENGQPLTGDYTVDQSQTFEAVYLPTVLDVTNDPEKVTPKGYLRVTFKAGEGVEIEKKVYDVKAGSVLDKDQFPKITVKDGYKNPGWNPAENTAISAERHEFTASAEKELRDALNKKDADTKVSAVEDKVKKGEKPTAEDIQAAQDAIDKIDGSTDSNAPDYDKDKKELQDRLDLVKKIVEGEDRLKQDDIKDKPANDVKDLQDAIDEGKKAIDSKDDKTITDATKKIEDAIVKINQERIAVGVDSLAVGAKTLEIKTSVPRATVVIKIDGVKIDTITTDAFGTFSKGLKVGLKEDQKVVLEASKPGYNDGGFSDTVY